ncbi:MAG TPA: nickel-dependent hydrogenase large subunit [Thermoanaerobacterales bacterium]|nr:nickel-dependent hydrogenase large subunit [Thermoanaerobacterales bacterium]
MPVKIISPVTRLNGFWRLDVKIENHRVVDAFSGGIFFRGLEKILLGRDPRDAVYLTERICGICSTAHAMAASLALEDAFYIEPPRNGIIIRNLIFGADLLQNHIRHFYFLTVPDFAPGPDRPPFAPRYNSDFRLNSAQNREIYENYMESIHMSRAAHDMVTIFGGKIPHNHGILAGGASAPPSGDSVRMFLSLLSRVREFIEQKMVKDAETLAEVYDDYFKIGVGHKNIMAYGMFSHPDKKGEFYFKPGVIINGVREKLDRHSIEEHVKFSWYEEAPPLSPEEGSTQPDTDKPGAYSWVKAPRYKGLAMEVGPLARLIISGDYPESYGTMDRILARVYEARKVAELMEQWALELEIGKPVFTPYDMPSEAEGMGMVEAMRGGLGHWLRVGGGRISHYQVITPSAWDCSPRDDEGKRGPVEESLVGTPVEDPDQPVEVGRVARSFDPCLACAVHVIDARGKEKEIEILL